MTIGSSMDPRLLEAYQGLIDDRVEDVHTCMPGIIRAVDTSKGNCDVEIVTIRKGQPLPILKDCRIAFAQSSQYSITFPVAPGDHCVVFFTELQLRHWRANQGQLREVTDDTPHAIDGCFVVPCLFPDNKTAAMSATDLVIQRKDGPSISITDSTIEVSGDLNVDGDLDVSGAISATGEVTAMSALPATKVTLSKHVHASVGATPTPGF